MINKDAGLIMDKEKPKPSMTIITLGILLIGMLFSGVKFQEWWNIKNLNYTPPTLSELQLSEGEVAFNKRWKSTGGYLILYFKTGKKLVLSCSVPGSPFDSECYRKDDQGTPLNFSAKVAGKPAKVWWSPDVDALNNKNLDGRLYRLEIEGITYFDYSERVQYYSNGAAGEKEGNSPVLAIILFIVLVLPPIFSLYKEKK